MTDELLPYMRCQRVCEQVRAEIYSPTGKLRKDKTINWKRCVELMEEANQLAAAAGIAVRYDVERFRPNIKKYGRNRLH